jgi:hypothetical protein
MNTVDATMRTVTTKPPIKQARKALRQANSIYNLPSTEQAIKWMQAVCGYPVKWMWLKAIKLGNYMGWLMLMEPQHPNLLPGGNQDR